MSPKKPEISPKNYLLLIWGLFYQSLNTWGLYNVLLFLTPKHQVTNSKQMGMHHANFDSTIVAAAACKVYSECSGIDVAHGVMNQTQNSLLRLSDWAELSNGSSYSGEPGLTRNCSHCNSRTSIPSQTREAALKMAIFTVSRGNDRMSYGVGDRAH